MSDVGLCMCFAAWAGLLTLLVLGCMGHFCFAGMCTWLLDLICHAIFSNLSFGRPGAFILTPLGTSFAPWRHPWGPWEQRKGYLGVQSQSFIDAGSISGPHFEICSSTLEQSWCLFVMLVLSFFF